VRYRGIVCAFTELTCLGGVRRRCGVVPPCTPLLFLLSQVEAALKALGEQVDQEEEWQTHPAVL
jgi:hypothetical protein